MGITNCPMHNNDSTQCVGLVSINQDTFLGPHKKHLWCFNATFSNISAISWRPVLMVEEVRVPGQLPTIGKHVVNFIIRVYGIKYKIFHEQVLIKSFRNEP